MNSEQIVGDKHHTRMWNLKDLIQFESYRLSDSGEVEENLERRDREIFHSLGDPEATRSEFFRYWLSQRVKDDSQALNLGETVVLALRILFIVVAILGVVFGASAAYATLLYDGKVPVNVSGFLGLLVLPQILLFVAQLGFVAVSLFNKHFVEFVYAVPRAWILFIWQWCVRTFFLSNSHDSKQIDALRYSSISIRKMFEQHGTLFGVRAYGLSQVFGVFFNIGVVLCAGVLLMFSDRAFGWQSSLTSSPERVLGILRWVASPWAWIWGEGVGYPNLESIQGSYIVLSEQSASLDHAHLVSWWPFLILGVVVYGLIPRVVLWAFSGVWNRRCLNHLEFDSVVYNPLWVRAHSLTLESQGLPSSNRMQEPLTEEVTSTPVENVKGYHAWISVEIEKRYSLDNIKRWLAEDRLLPVSSDSSYSGIPCFSEIKGPFLLVLEGWQPPIQEKMGELTEIAQSPELAGKDLYVVLLGKPRKEGIAALNSEMIDVWKNKIQLLELPNLHLITQIKKD